MLRVFRGIIRFIDTVIVRCIHFVVNFETLDSKDMGYMLTYLVSFIVFVFLMQHYLIIKFLAKLLLIIVLFRLLYFILYSNTTPKSKKVKNNVISLDLSKTKESTLKSNCTATNGAIVNIRKSKAFASRSKKLFKKRISVIRGYCIEFLNKNE